MCIIIDANCINEVVNKTKNADPVMEWISGADGHWAIGGSKLREEYSKYVKIFTLLSELSRSGKLKRYDDDSVDSAQKKGRTIWYPCFR